MNVLFLYSYSNRRANHDLIMTIDLELVEALCGFQKTIETLDGRQLVITMIPGEVIKPGEVKCVMNEGMPVSGDYTHRGKLIIQFNVNFPKEIPPELVATLENCLPPRYLHNKKWCYISMHFIVHLN